MTRSALHYALMAMVMKSRDSDEFTSPYLDAIPIEPEQVVLDFGCGRGSFSFAAAKRVGALGKVYALDFQPLAIFSIEHKIRKSGIRNIKAIESDCATGLGTESVDVVLMFDILADLPDKEVVMAELFRILKPEGVLAISDHHWSFEKLLYQVSDCSRFHVRRRLPNMVLFEKPQAENE